MTGAKKALAFSTVFSGFSMMLNGDVLSSQATTYTS